MKTSNPKVGLFVTCIVDIMRPNIGFAALSLLEQAGCQVEVPHAQTCCGQPAFNSGDKKDTVSIAKQVIEAFEHFDYIVAPSGSCAAMIKIHYPKVFEDDHEWLNRATQLADKTYELLSFLVDVRHYKPSAPSLNKSVTYHDSCSGYRELGIYHQPRKLLNSVDGLKFHEMKDSTECCGFGGTFCVKYADISNVMVTDKTQNAENTEADWLVGGDYGCLMNIEGKLHRQGSHMKVFHIAEVLTIGTDTEKT